MANHDHPNGNPLPLPKVTPFKDTMQFHLVDLSPDKAQRFLDVMAMEGVACDLRSQQECPGFPLMALHGGLEILKEQTVANIEFAGSLVATSFDRG